MKQERTTTVESLLGMLSLGPMSGYEIRQLMEQSTANFWSESFGQIYPALKRLVAQGLAEMDESQSEGQRLRKVYRLTEAGKGRLQEWLGLPCEPQVKRNELLLKLFFGAQAGAGEMQGQIERRRELLTATLSRYQEIERGITGLHGHHPGLPFFLIVVRYGIAEMKALIGWCDESLMDLKRHEETQRSKSGIESQRRRDGA